MTPDERQFLVILLILIFAVVEGLTLAVTFLLVQ
jgi:hypothetical protein